MPRFFFHIHNGHGDTPDELGTDLEDQASAKRLAIDSIRSMISEDARRGVIDLKGWIEVADSHGNRLTSVEFSDAFDLRLPTAKDDSNP